MTADRLDLDALEASVRQKEALFLTNVMIERETAAALIAAARDAVQARHDVRIAQSDAARWMNRTDSAESERDAAQAALARVEALHWSFRGYRIAANGAVAEEIDACDACDDSHPCATIRALRGEGQEAGGK